MTKEIILGLIGASCILGCDVNAMKDRASAKIAADKAAKEQRLDQIETLAEQNYDVAMQAVKGPHELRPTGFPAPKELSDPTVISDRIESLRNRAIPADSEIGCFCQSAATAMENLFTLYQLSDRPIYRTTVDEIWRDANARLEAEGK